MSKLELTLDGYRFFCEVYSVHMCNGYALLAYSEYKRTGKIPAWWFDYLGGKNR